MRAAATSAATVATANGTRYSTLGAWSHWLAAINATPAATAHHVQRPGPVNGWRAP